MHRARGEAVAAHLLPGEAGLLQQDHVHSGPRQVVRGRGAGRARPHHDHLGVGSRTGRLPRFFRTGRLPRVFRTGRPLPVFRAGSLPRISRTGSLPRVRRRRVRWQFPHHNPFVPRAVAPAGAAAQGNIIDQDGPGRYQASENPGRPGDPALYAPSVTTPPDETITDALDHADAALLARRLDALTCPPDLLGRMVRHPAPRIRHLGLALLAERADAPVSGDGGEDTAGAHRPARHLLPDSPGSSPEESLLLAGLHARLAARQPRHRLPDWRAAALPARVRIAWLRAEILGDPAVLRTEPAGEPLYRAVRACDAAGAHRPDRLVAELVGTGDPVLGAEALRLARAGLHAGLLAPAFVRGRLVRLLDSPDPGVVTDALRELAEPWAAVTPVEASPLIRPARALGGRSADRDGPSAALAAAALLAAARHGHPTELWSTAEDPAGAPALRGQAVELLGERAERSDVGRLVALAGTDPFLLAGPVLTCLRALHRRGHFPAATDVGPLLSLALTDHTLPAEDFATVLYTCRHPLFDALTGAPPTAPDWPRRLELLVALSAQGAEDVPIGEAIIRLLPAARAPRPFLAAIRALRPPAAEEAVLALLPTAPAAALDALEAVGGDRTRSALAHAFGVGGPADGPPTAADGPSPLPVAPELRPVRDRALALLWHLTHRPGQRHELLSRLAPQDLPRDIEADLGAPDERELAVLRARVDLDAPVAAFCRIAAHAGGGPASPEGVPLADLLLRIVRDLAAGRLGPGPDAPGPGLVPAGPGRPDGEPELPPEVLEATRALGSRLWSRRRIRPVCLLEAPDGTAAGHAFLTATVLGLLERPELTGGERAVLLKALLQSPATPATRARVHRLLRDRDPHVRKHVIALLAHDATGEDARALSATLVPLTRDPDIRTVRAALSALGAARARWAGEAVAGCLHHPNMNIRKTAAAALLDAGAPAAVPHLLRALGRDDNPGLRTALTRALRAVVGDAHAATLLAAAEAAPDERTRRLLLRALDQEVTVHAVFALDAGGSPVVPALLALVADGGVRLAAGSVQDLAEPLARHGVPTPPAAPGGPPDGADPEVAALLRSGWDPALALRVARRPAPPDTVGGHERRAARALLGHWLDLAGSTPEAGLRARLLRCALRLCPGPWSAARRRSSPGTRYGSPRCSARPRAGGSGTRGPVRGPRGRPRLPARGDACSGDRSQPPRRADLAWSRVGGAGPAAHGRRSRRPRLVTAAVRPRPCGLGQRERRRSSTAPTSRGRVPGTRRTGRHRPIRRARAAGRCPGPRR
ncbi:hypothetical protein SGRI78S_06343 [Streptomyces griseus subsp. griseus]